MSSQALHRMTALKMIYKVTLLPLPCSVLIIITIILLLEYVDGDTNALFSEIDLLEERLQVMKLLSVYGVNKPLYMLRDKWTKTNPEEVKEIISRVCQSGTALYLLYTRLRLLFVSYPCASCPTLSPSPS